MTTEVRGQRKKYLTGFRRPLLPTTLTTMTDVDFGELLHRVRGRMDFYEETRSPLKGICNLVLLDGTLTDEQQSEAVEVLRGYFGQLFPQESLSGYWFYHRQHLEIQSMKSEWYSIRKKFLGKILRDVYKNGNW